MLNKILDILEDNKDDISFWWNILLGIIVLWFFFMLVQFLFS